MRRRFLISGLPMAATYAHIHVAAAQKVIGDPMIRKLSSFVALAGASLLACWNLAVAQTPMAPCLAVNASAPQTCGTTTTTPPTGSLASDPFPRTYIIYYGSPTASTSSAGVPFSTVASETNIINLSNVTNASAIQSWKSAAGANGVTLRVTGYAPGFAPSTVSGGRWLWLANALNASNMWAYTSAAGSGNTDLAGFSGYLPGQGVLMLTPASAQTVASFTYNGKTGVNAGMTVWANYAQYYYDSYIAGLASSKYGESAIAADPYLDGIFLDNMNPGAQQMSGSAAWNGWGTSPVSDSAPTTTAAIQQGGAKLVQAFRALKPGILMTGNTAWSAFQPALDPSNQNLWTAVFQEEVIGQPYSIETAEFNSHGTAAGIIARLASAEATIAAGGTLVLHMDGLPGGSNGLTGNQSGWSPSQWRAVRYGFAAAMQRNYHFSFNCGQQQYGCVGLMDEQVQTTNGTANYGWLSAGTQRLDPPQSAAWTNGVWRRRFPNGWVLWNPRGNGPQTVTIPSTLCRIQSRGYGDSTVNSGACGATTVTLQDADGLFLVGTG